MYIFLNQTLYTFVPNARTNKRNTKTDGQANASGVIKRIEEISNSINNGFVQHVRLSCLREERKRKIQIYMCVRVDFCRWEQRLIRSFVHSSRSLFR